MKEASEVRIVFGSIAIVMVAEVIFFMFAHLLFRDYGAAFFDFSACDYSNYDEDRCGAVVDGYKAVKPYFQYVWFLIFPFVCTPLFYFLFRNHVYKINKTIVWSAVSTLMPIAIFSALGEAGTVTSAAHASVLLLCLGLSYIWLLRKKLRPI